MRERPAIDEATLARLLEASGARTAVSGGFLVAAPWALRFPAPERGKLKFFALVQGRLVLEIDGARHAIAAGDVFILTQPHAYTLGDGRTPATIDARALFANNGSAIARLSAEADAFVLGGHIALSSAGGPLLTSTFSPVIHLRADAPEAITIRWLLEQLVGTGEAPLGATNAASGPLAQLLFVQLLRLRLAAPQGILRGLVDPQLSRALADIHAHPEQPWTVDALARRSGMSRTRFAARFKQTIGMAPLAYVTRWRMQLAEQALRTSHVSIGELAGTLGYATESAFSTAFKRVTGVAPSALRG